jgi:hypothetical protein
MKSFMKSFISGTVLIFVLLSYLFGAYLSETDRRYNPEGVVFKFTEPHKTIWIGIQEFYRLYEITLEKDNINKCLKDVESLVPEEFRLSVCECSSNMENINECLTTILLSCISETGDAEKCIDRMQTKKSKDIVDKRVDKILQDREKYIK